MAVVADAVRGVALALTILVVAGLPRSIGVTNRPRRAWLLIGAVETAFVSGMFAMAHHFGESLVWYRAPLLLVAAVMALLYIVTSFEHK